MQNQDENLLVQMATEQRDRAVKRISELPVTEHREAAMMLADAVLVNTGEMPAFVVIAGISLALAEIMLRNVSEQASRIQIQVAPPFIIPAGD